MDLSTLKGAYNPLNKKANRVGRGEGSGNGKTCGKGQKGQKSRSGGGTKPGFEGGQMPLYRRIPKRGFTNRNSKRIVTIDVSRLDLFDEGSEVTIDSLIEKGILKNPRDGVKILGSGELNKKLSVKVNAYSEGAKSKIEKAGGTAEVI